MNRIKFNLNNCIYIRNNWTTEASKLYMHAMILSHINDCLTSWTQTSRTTLQQWKDFISRLWKHDKIRNQMFITIVTFSKICFPKLGKHDQVCWYITFNGLAPPLLSEFIKQNQNTSRRSAWGDCIIPYRAAFSVSLLLSSSTHLELHTNLI